MIKNLSGVWTHKKMTLKCYILNHLNMHIMQTNFILKIFFLFFIQSMFFSFDIWGEI